MNLIPKHFIQTLLLSIVLILLHGCATLFEEGSSGMGGQTRRSELQDSWQEDTVSQSASSQRPYRDLMLGMQMGDVRSSWGEPSRVDVAGDPRLGHQRWTYTLGRTLSSQLSSQRVVYFDSGRVVGWETR